MTDDRAVPAPDRFLAEQEYAPAEQSAASADGRQPSSPGRPLDGSAAADRAEAAADRTHSMIVLVVLLVDTALLAMLQLMFLTTSAGQTPVPVSALIALVSTPWLVRKAGAVAGVAGASAVLVVWLLTTSVLSLAGPGGDALLPVGWSTPVLLAAALLPGAFALGRVIRARLAPRKPGVDAREGDDARLD